MKNGDFPYSYVSLPEGSGLSTLSSWENLWFPVKMFQPIWKLLDDSGTLKPDNIKTYSTYWHNYLDYPWNQEKN